MKEGDGENLDGDFDSSRALVVEAENVATEGKYGADECEPGLRERKRDVSERGLFKQEV